MTRKNRKWLLERVVVLVALLIFMLRKSGRARVATLASATAHRLRDFPGRRGAARERKL